MAFTPSPAPADFSGVAVGTPAAPALLDRQQIHECPFGASSVKNTNNLLVLIKITVKQGNFEQFRFGPSSICIKLTNAQNEFSSDSSTLSDVLQNI